MKNRTNVSKAIKVLLILGVVVFVVFFGWGLMETSANQNVTDGSYPGLAQEFVAFIVSPALFLLAGILAVVNRSAKQKEGAKNLSPISSNSKLAALYWVSLIFAVLIVVDKLFIDGSTAAFATSYLIGFLVGFGYILVPAVGIIGIIYEKAWKQRIIPLLLLGFSVWGLLSYMLPQLGK